MKVFALLLISLIAPSARLQTPTAEQLYSVPAWARPVLDRQDFKKAYELDAHLNPFCHRADFDGDGKPDLAVLIRERSSGKIGIAFVHRGTLTSYIVGAGKPGVRGGDDYTWMDAWIVFDKGPVPRGAGDPPILKGDALIVFKTEAASAILWWSGTGYRWYQQGD